jgi:hypothetical protein
MAMSLFRTVPRREAAFTRFSGLERALFAGAISLAAGSACAGAQNEQAPAENATAPEGQGASETPGAGDGEPAQPVAAPHGKRAPCANDQSCNENPAVSALWGRCTEMGICECNPGFERSPTSDLCRPAQ